tara:strand:- start:45 stop:383 length:339 start_codon:yes stop_codon:yes gene_type:complete
MVYAKAITNFQTSVGLDVDGNNVLNFAYEVKDNFDEDSGAFDSYNSYSYFIPVSDITLTIVTDLDSLNNSYFEISWGKNQIAFPVGEYYSIDTNTVLNPALVYGLISSTIYP